MPDSLSAKPPLPADLFAPWPRQHVDTTEGSPFRRITRTATGAADDWALGPNGAFKQPGLSLADIIHTSVEQALLHLLELGLIDIDTERLATAKGVPVRRRDSRPAEGEVTE
ncbi:hypothetical protein OHV05_24595 [Kitasatospora sp. NBC_00070]|uniref:hypothetical protein n=1 Tax=Kitasatospora sp. NBC_00070 TaxID=2975962 RepID=UPI003243213A